MEAWQEHGLKMLRLMPAAGKRVVDVGCGDGWASLELKRMGADVTATDHLVEEHPKLVEIHRQGIPYVFSVATLKMDVVWCHHVLEHIEAPIDFLRELQRIGEQLWLVVPKATLGGMAKDHINNYTMPVLIEHLRRAGWNVRDGSYRTYPGPSAGALWAVVERWKKSPALSPYPAPMDVFNHEGQNHLRDDVNEWNWDAVEKGAAI